MKKTKLVIFGTGNFYQDEKEKFDMLDNIQICAFLDNNVKLRGVLLDGIQIYSPLDLNNIQYEYIVLMSIYATEMHEKLIQMGVDKGRILYWCEFLTLFLKNQRVYYTNNINKRNTDNKILIVARQLDYSGSTMTAIYAAQGLQSRNYKVDLAAPDGDIRLIHEINNSGIDVIIYNVLPYIQVEEWVKEYKAVIVNVFPMIQCACEISKYRPVLWWIHEPKFVFEQTIKYFPVYAHEQSMKYTSIYAVSDIAKDNFNNYFPHTANNILHYGIPDMLDINEKIKRKNKKKKIIFAIIGTVTELKAQDIFLQAANQIEAAGQAEFWIIGALDLDDYGRRITKMADSSTDVKIKGVLTREEIYNVFPQIDVVVCASREETMSLTVNEGMMFGKVCITTDNTGVADYIQNGENGFVVPVGDIEALRKRMQWIIDNRTQMNRIGLKARETYEKYFSMEIFGEHLEKAVNETIEKWKQRG